VRAYVQDFNRGRPRQKSPSATPSPEHPDEIAELEQGYLELERHAQLDSASSFSPFTLSSSSTSSFSDIDADESPSLDAAISLEEKHTKERERQEKLSQKERDQKAGRVVDVVISDMSAPWDQTTGFSQRSFTEPYRRMMNTSGNSFRDHIGSLVCPASLGWERNWEAIVLMSAGRIFAWQR
jgi:21S rRNA (uridine2791-2'-O)-methyltransferase